MIQTQNQTQAQFKALECKIEIQFNNIFNEQFPKSSNQLNSEIMNFILRFSNDLQIEMAINFIRILKKLVHNYIENDIIPLLTHLNFHDQTQGCSNLECFNKMYQQYIQKSKYLLTSLYYAINLLFPQNPLETLKYYLNYLLLQQLISTNIQEQLFNSFFQQLDVVYFLIEDKQDNSWQEISFVLKKFVDILLNLQLIDIKIQFTTLIQSHFQKKYQILFDIWRKNFKIPVYLRKVKMQKEFNNKILNFDDTSIKQDVNSYLEEYLLKNYKSFIISDTKPYNLESLLENFNYEDQENYDDLQLLNELYLSLNPNDQEIKMKIKQQIIQEGNLIMQLINNQEINKIIAHSFIISLYQLHHKYRKMIEICLNYNTNIQSLLTNAFEELLNFTNQKFDFQEYFVLFIEQEIEYIINNKTNKQQLLDTVQLLLYIYENCDFTIYYQNRLAQRLFNYYRILSINDFNQIYLKIELMIIQNMSSLMGNQTIYNFESMIEEFSKGFETIFEFQTENHKLLSVQHPLLLREQNWPKFQELPIKLNEEFQTIINLKLQFESQYYQKLITWLDFLSYFDIEYSKKQITFRINIPQAIILYIYQYQNKLMSIQMIQQITKLQELLILQNCSEMKAANILEELVINDVIYYRFNEDLEDTQIRKIIITNTYIPILYLKKTKSKRNLYQPIEAFILKTIKISKQSLFQDMIQIVQEYIKTTFKEYVQVDQIQTIIKDLIKKEYLEIDASNPELLKYI